MISVLHESKAPILMKFRKYKFVIEPNEIQKVQIGYQTFVSKIPKNETFVIVRIPTASPK